MLACLNMGATWNVLVVDDEEDIHSITRLALRRKSWRDRPIVLTSARSAEMARSILTAADAPTFHCALVDVVMESDVAGLELCDFIRSTAPRTLRIILRTGQPGVAPPEKVMNDYDIDYYLAKTEVTEQRLFSTLRACFRSSLDIAALLAVSTQLKGFTVALQDVSTTEGTLVDIMRDSLRFLEDKYSAQLAFVVNAAPPPDATAIFGDRLADAVAAAHKKNLSPMFLHSGQEVGLDEGTFVVVTTVLQTVDRSEKSMSEKVRKWFRSLVKEESEEPTTSGLALKFERPLAKNSEREFLQDLELLVANWRVAETSLHLQNRIVRDRMEMMKHYKQS
jgi:CheY-like chemotaxis protein